MAARALVVFVALAVGCKDDAVAALESARARVCECKDATCVNAAMESLRDHPTNHQRKAESVAREIMDCVARVYQQTDAGSDDEDAGGEIDDSGSGSGSGADLTPTGR